MSVQRDSVGNEPQLSVVVPVCNEAENVEPLAREIHAALGSRAYEMIFIDDGSTDRSFAVLTRLLQEDRHLRVIRFRRNYGQTAAMAAGLSHASPAVAGAVSR